ncbi:MAG: FAD-binding oxidoreductase [Clostridiales bacterium]|jgi:D-lactate dehydrogenase (cytochrome)|nr:FAD-binding oxidoreductase [Clostridiales bacterium]
MEIIAFDKDKYAGYLRDESGLTGRADFIAFPRDGAELSEALAFAAKNAVGATVQGARTGLFGAAVPRGGLVISTEKLTRVYGACQGADGGYTLRVQSGVTLKEINDYLRGERRLFGGERYAFAPNPTEANATVGGMLVRDAIGLNALRSGRFSEHVSSLTVVKGDGSTIGYATAKELLSDKRAGADRGEIFAVLDAELRLTKKDSVFWGVFYFFDGKKTAEEFIGGLLSRRAARGFLRDALAALVWFDGEVLRRVSERRLADSSLQGLPEFPADARAAVYAELSGDDGAALESELCVHAELFEKIGGADTWAETGEDEIQKFRAVCHAAVEVAGRPKENDGDGSAYGYADKDGNIVFPS